MPHRIPVLLVFVIAVIAAPLRHSAIAAEPAARSSFHALPNDTLAVLRLPQPAAFAAELRERTRLGQLILGPQQRQRLDDFMAKRLHEFDDKMVESLSSHGLKKEDLPALLTGPTGVALCALESSSPAQPPRLLLLGWLEPEAELTDRALAAFERLVDAQIDQAGPEAPRRVDLDLVDRQVICVTYPVMRMPAGFKRHRLTRRHRPRRRRLSRSTAATCSSPGSARVCCSAWRRTSDRLPHRSRRIRTSTR